MSNPINESGTLGENHFETLLNENDIPFKSGGNNGIDYIVFDKFYMDSKNQTQGGSVDEKIPHTIFKYHEKYNQPKYYIVGYYEYKEGIKRHIKFLENKLNIKVYFYTPEEMIEVIKESGIKPLMDKFV
tara:strand:+ start:90 stop:476 length:387 start_codon:yes stop_codon:yes gene_type:complete